MRPSRIRPWYPHRGGCTSGRRVRSPTCCAGSGCQKRCSWGSASEHDGELADGERDEHDSPHTEDCPEHLPLVLRAVLPEIDRDDAQTVERVEEDGGDESGLAEAHDRVLVFA